MKKTGAPYKYGEKTEKKTFRIPISFFKFLKKIASERNKSIVEILIEKFKFKIKKD